MAPNIECRALFVPRLLRIGSKFFLYELSYFKANKIWSDKMADLTKPPMPLKQLTLINTADLMSSHERADFKFVFQLTADMNKLLISQSLADFTKHLIPQSNWSHWTADTLNSWFFLIDSLIKIELSPVYTYM